jgi:hypothetical protein
MKLSNTTANAGGKLCPSCIRRPGTLKSLAVGHGAVTLTLNCPSCGHTWHVERGVRTPRWADQVAHLIRPRP